MNDLQKMLQIAGIQNIDDMEDFLLESLDAAETEFSKIGWLAIPPQSYAYIQLITDSGSYKHWKQKGNSSFIPAFMKTADIEESKVDARKIIPTSKNNNNLKAIGNFHSGINDVIKLSDSKFIVFVDNKYANQIINHTMLTV